MVLYGFYVITHSAWATRVLKRSVRVRARVESNSTDSTDQLKNSTANATETLNSTPLYLVYCIVLMYFNHAFYVFIIHDVNKEGVKASRNGGTEDYGKRKICSKKIKSVRERVCIF